MPRVSLWKHFSVSNIIVIFVDFWTRVIFPYKQNFF